jgi:hypothetical protein
MSDTTLAWHFVGDTLRDGSPVPPDGEWLVHDGPVECCRSGLHASERLIDALEYAPGATICRVECRGIEDRHNDKIAARERRILWRIDGGPILREFARRQALTVIHLWAAGAAAWAAARDAAWDAESAAARAAARDAANTMLTEMVEQAHERV